jgi:4-hydroxybenzoate polyprenyltransferase
MPAALRLIHPAPAAAVVALSAALAVILAREAGQPIDWRVALIVLSVAGSQVATGAFNDWADRARDAGLRPEKPIPAGQLTASAAVAIGTVALIAQLASSALLGPLALLLGAIAIGSALLYDVALSRTPLSVLPYVVSFGLLPAWIASGIGVPVERVFGAMLLVAPFAAAAHLANALRDFTLDEAGSSRNLAQLLGRTASHRLAVGLTLGVGFGLAVALATSARLLLGSALLGGLGLAAVGIGATAVRRLWPAILVAAVCWTIAWALATGG